MSEPESMLTPAQQAAKQSRGILTSATELERRMFFMVQYRPISSKTQKLFRELIVSMRQDAQELLDKAATLRKQKESDDRRGMGTDALRSSNEEST